MRQAVYFLAAMATVFAIASAPTMADPAAERGWTLVGEDGEGNVIVERLTEAELQHTPGGGVDNTCGGFAPVALTCDHGPVGPFHGMSHGFLIADCVAPAVHQECYVGTLESTLAGDDGDVRTFRVALGSAANVGLAYVTQTTGVFPDDQSLTQTCSSYTFWHRFDLADPVVPGGTGSWLCFFTGDE